MFFSNVAVRDLIEAGITDTDSLKNTTVVDLGSGFGRLCVGCLAPMGFKQVTGAELEPTLCSFSRQLRNLVAREVELTFDSQL